VGTGDVGQSSATFFDDFTSLALYNDQSTSAGGTWQPAEWWSPFDMGLDSSGTWLVNPFNSATPFNNVYVVNGALPYITPVSGSFQDGSGSIYTIDGGRNALKNGVAMNGGSGVGAMEYYNNTVYAQKAASGSWFTWNGSQFVGPVTAPASPAQGGPGILSLRYDRTPTGFQAACGGDTTIGSMLQTANTFQALFGYWEVKFSAPKIVGTNLLVWMIDNSGQQEIDLVRDLDGLGRQSDWQIRYLGCAAH
jgi:hypothetical protein